MPAPAPGFNDPADRPAASYRPDLANEIDTLEDVLSEFISDAEIEPVVVNLISEVGRTRAMTPGVRRVVVAIAAGALRKADNRGVIQQMFGCTEPVTRSEVADFAASLRELIDADRNPRLQAKCADFVLGLGLNGGVNQTVIASEEGVGKAAVSKRCRNLVKKLGREPARGMKKEEACDAYRQRQMGKRARPPREPWVFTGMLTRVLTTLGGLNVAPAT